MTNHFVNSNHLAFESSPYLRQHAENPVHWWPWRQEAFDNARSQNRLIFLSIGYSTCHWCHVMAHECFENTEIADILSTNYLAIKVDREELPEVDDFYMAAVHAMGVHGGWPLSIWLTPDLKPFYGGTYFPPSAFIRILKEIQNIWLQNPDDIQARSEDLLGHLKKVATLGSYSKDMDGQFNLSEAQQLLSHQIKAQADYQLGGFRGSPKFPPTMAMQITYQEKEEPKNEISNWANLTAWKMACGGLHDHLVGGFHRYSTDEKWLVPHFEKMLYDNALLLRFYSECYIKFKRPEYKEVAQNIVQWLKQEMTSPLGGFFSAQDADSLNPLTNQKEEGYAHTFSWQDLSILTAEDLQNLGAIPQGHLPPDHRHQDHSDGSHLQSRNLEGRIIVHLPNCWSWPGKENAFEILRKIRQDRPSPETDTKIITAWNSLMISSLAHASHMLKESRWLELAIKSMEFICDHLAEENKLWRSYCDGKRSYSATANDYAAVSLAAMDLFECTGDDKWAHISKKWMDACNQNFWNSTQKNWLAQNVLVAMPERYEGVIPSTAALALEVLCKLFAWSGELTYRNQAYEVVQTYSEDLMRTPLALPKLFEATKWLDDLKLIYYKNESPFANDWRWQNPFSNVFLLPAPKAFQQPGFYLCHQGICEAPVLDIQKLISTFYT